MPRTPKISHDKLKAAIFNADGVIDANGGIPGPANSVWATINDNVNGLLTPTYIYQYVHENRHNSYTELRRKFGIPSPPAMVEEDKEINSISNSDSASTSTVEEIEEQIKPSKTFLILIPFRDWEKIKPIKKKYRRTERKSMRTYNILPPFEWTSIIMGLMWEQHKIPCPYSFERATVYSDIFQRNEFLTITGKCNECGAIGKGRILEEPVSESDVILEWRANDTRSTPHDKKRHLTGTTRKIVSGVHLKNTAATLYRRLTAYSLMVQGDLEAPHLYKPTVLRKAKQEQRDKLLQVVQGAHPIVSLGVMKHSQPYAGSIHDVSLDKVVVHYYTPSQMLVYKTHWKQTYTVLCLDATGSLVQKLRRVHDLSGHIFLYELVMNTGEHQLPVLQMLSEKHDANTISYWLNEWIRNGAPCPRELNIDNSAALKSAVARSFGRSSDLQDYIEKCYRCLLNESETLPPCYLRLDVAHFLNAAKKWKLWQSKERQRLQDFYLRCLGLLIKSTSMEEFGDVLLHVLSISLAINEDDNSESDPIQESLDFLSKKIKGTGDIVKEIVTEMSSTKCEKEMFTYLESDNVEEMMDCKRNTKLFEWFQEIYDEVENRIDVETEGRLNPYYCPGVAEELKRLSPEFTLWSGVLVNVFKSPNLTASSAPVESDFADVKMRIMLGSSKQLRIDKFVAMHLQSIEGSCRIVGSSSKKRKLQELPSTKTNTLVAGDNEAVLYFPALKRERRCDFVDIKPEKPSIKINEREENTSKEVDTNPKLGFENEVDHGLNICSDTIKTKEIIDENSASSLKGDTIHISHELGFDDSKSDTVTTRNSSGTSPCDLNSIEDWRGLAKRGRRKNSKYLSSLPHFEAAVKAKRLKQPSKRLMKNGNYTGFIIIKGGSNVTIKNTCGFDSICQVLAEAYIMNEECRPLMDRSKNALIQTSRNLALDGAITRTLQQRAEVLCSVLDPAGSLKLPIIKTRAKKRSLTALEFDCWSNAPTLARKLLQGEHCVEVFWDCKGPDCVAPKQNKHSILDVNASVLLGEGLGSLDKAIVLSLRVVNSSDMAPALPNGTTFVRPVCGQMCNNEVTVTCNMSAFIIVDIDFLSQEGVGKLLAKTDINNRPYKLSEFPSQMCLFGVSYAIVGIVAYRPAHYVAYTKRSQDTWEIFDDLAKGVTVCREEEQISPHMVVYAKL